MISNKARIGLPGAAVLATALLANSAWGQVTSADVPVHEPLVFHALVDQLEHRVQKGGSVLAWDALAWYGGDYEKLYITTEGELRDYGRGGISQAFERAEVQALYSRLIGYYWDIQGGVRFDARPSPSRAYAAIGVLGLAPGYFEVNAQAFISQEGDLSARLELEYDLLITQRLVLQPRVEIDAALQDVPEIGVGTGISQLEAGLRLRYEFVREFAPYIGVNYETATGRTAKLARAEGEDVDAVAFVLGVRFWF